FLAAQLGVKRLELLRDTVPGLTRVALLSPVSDPLADPLHQEIQAAADTMGLRIQVLLVHTDEELEPALNMALQGDAQALMTMPAPIFGVRNAERIGQFAAEHRLPVMGSNRDAAARGSYLLAYAADSNVVRRRSAYYVDRILKGARPADLPV